MWTDRFITLPIEMINRKDEDLGLDDVPVFEDYITVLPSEISGWRKRFEGDPPEYKGQTIIEFKNRENIIVCLTLEELEITLNSHQK